MKSQKGFFIQLHEDAFSQVCAAMIDPENDARAEASRVLGCFENVTEHFLLQTLDKKIIPHPQFQVILFRITLAI